MGAKLIGRHKFISFISGNEGEKAGKELSFGQGLDDGDTSQKAAEDSVIVVCTPAAQGQMSASSYLPMLMRSVSSA
jgi:hypothetical protein